MSGIWAVVPIKEFSGAKQRLAPRLSPQQRQSLAAIMVEDVLHTLAAVSQLAGIVVVTVDPLARSLAERYGARVVTDGARDGHTGAVTSAARLLAQERRDGMITLPGDIPRILASEVAAALAAHKSAPAFTIVPAHDELGSNAIICSPPDAVPFRFGEDSFFPHLDAARRAGIAPSILHQPGIAMDIDHPADLVAFLRMSPRIPTRTLAFLEQSGIAGELLAEATAAR
jgi:2-phospho-L-lactate/phosphoenolpyruvate guanylyltransferase